MKKVVIIRIMLLLKEDNDDGNVRVYKEDDDMAKCHYRIVAYEYH